MFNSDGTAILTDCTVSGNTAQGPAADCSNSRFLTDTVITLTNCTVSGRFRCLQRRRPGRQRDGNSDQHDRRRQHRRRHGRQRHHLGEQQPDQRRRAAVGPGRLRRVDANHVAAPGQPGHRRRQRRGAPGSDQRGVARSGRVDIGAFQSEGFTLTPATGSSPQATGTGRAFGNPLTVTVSAINPAEPVNGNMIFFTAPGHGRSATLSAASATVTNGQAGVSATAGMTAGSYTVTASPGLHLPAAGLAATTNTGPRRRWRWPPARARRRWLPRRSPRRSWLWSRIRSATRSPASPSRSPRRRRAPPPR